ncbi:hypothetical protein BH23PAT1_BH23PAT1_2070 [soil metagenome]
MAINKEPIIIPTEEILNAQRELESIEDNNGLRNERGQFVSTDEFNSNRKIADQASLDDDERLQLGSLRNKLRDGELPEDFRRDFTLGRDQQIQQTLEVVEGRLGLDIDTRQDRKEARLEKMDSIRAKRIAKQEELAEQEQAAIKLEVSEFASGLRDATREEIEAEYNARLEQVDSRTDVDSSGKKVLKALLEQDRQKALADSAIDARNAEVIKSKAEDLQNQLADGMTASERAKAKTQQEAAAAKRAWKERMGVGQPQDASHSKKPDAPTLTYDPIVDGSYNEWVSRNNIDRLAHRQKLINLYDPINTSNHTGEAYKTDNLGRDRLLNNAKRAAKSLLQNREAVAQILNDPSQSSEEKKKAKRNLIETEKVYTELPLWDYIKNLYNMSDEDLRITHQETLELAKKELENEVAARAQKPHKQQTVEETRRQRASKWLKSRKDAAVLAIPRSMAWVGDKASLKKEQLTDEEKKKRGIYMVLGAAALGVVTYVAYKTMTDSSAINGVDGINGLDGGTPPPDINNGTEGLNGNGLDAGPDAAPNAPATPEPNAPPSAVQPPPETLPEHIGVLEAKGNTVWEDAHDHLIHLGNSSPSEAQILEETRRILELNEIPWEDTKKLPVGFKFQV